MVRIPFLIFTASLLPWVVTSSVVAGRSFIKRATDEEICRAANYYICSDRVSCCPHGFLCQGDGCIRAPSNTSDTPSSTDVVITVTVTASPKSALGSGAIAGIAVGGAIFLVAVGVAIFFCVRKRKIGKEVLKAYEDPNRNMYDQVVVEGKRISVIPIGGTTTQQSHTTQSQLPPPSEVQEFANIEGDAVGLKPEGKYPQQQDQQQPQQYQSYQQQPQQAYYSQGQDQVQHDTDLISGQLYPPQQPSTPPCVPEPIPDALRVGSPVSPIRADSMGLIPVAVDTADGGQHPYQFGPIQSMIRHHSTPLSPPPHHNTEYMPQSTSLPNLPTPSTSPPPQTPASHSPVYYQTQTPPPPPRETSPQQTSGGYQTPQATYSHQHQQSIHRVSSPPNRYSAYPHYQQYPAPPEEAASPISPIEQNRYSMHPNRQDPQQTNNYNSWGQL